MEHSSIIIIPLYKSTPTEAEIASFNQCLSILGKYRICIVTYKDVDINKYNDISTTYKIKIYREDFDALFFANITGYNQLMLSKEFYKRFSDYEYMLIYQLDAWVFRDELNNWCDQGYDYIGAPWISKDEKGYYHFAGVGNGGFSLRRVRHFIDTLSYKGPVKDGNNLKLKPSLKNRIYKFFYSLGYQNTINYYKKDPTLFEDVFLTIFLNNTKLQANTPSALTAANFAFEKEPTYLYSITKQLPFGCHAWQKYEYDCFWFNHISLK